MNTDQYLREQGVKFKHRTHSPAYTAQELAAEEHVPGRDVVKTVIVKANGKYVMCVLPACCKLDLDKVGEALRAKQCCLAEESELASLYPDAEIGAQSPLGNLYDMPTLVDSRLTEDERIVFPAGSHRDAIEMGYADYERLAKPSIADFAIHV